ncbi:MAG: flagellar export protein FliJ [Thermoflexaceae bacterium]|nr:flagellar export protein FliJ [Thermoflexaceae bacterium]
MAKFIYRLQNVLDVKLKMESQAKTEFSVAAERLDEEEEKMNLLLQKKAELEEEYRKKSSGRLDIMALKHARESVEYEKGRIELQKTAINQAKKQLEIARYHLNEAMKDRKIHEKLKEKAFEEFLMEENEAEKKEIDQLVSFKYNDNGKAGAR